MAEAIYTMGVDIGSTASKSIILKDGRVLISYFQMFVQSLISVDKTPRLLKLETTECLKTLL